MKGRLHAQLFTHPLKPTFSPPPFLSDHKTTPNKKNTARIVFPNRDRRVAAIRPEIKSPDIYVDTAMGTDL